MFYSYTGSKYKNIFVRFFIHQINAPSYYYYFSKFYCRNEIWGYAKVFIKKEEKKLRKNGHKSV
jgi:hypothetical protein